MTRLSHALRHSLLLRALAGIACLFALGACTPAEAPWAVTPLSSPALPGSAQAHLAAGAEGQVFLSWQEPQSDGATALRLARFDAGQWVDAGQVAAGDNWFVNWADFASVVPLGPQLLVAHWLELKPEQRYAYDIRFAVSRDGGAQWRDAGRLNGDTAIAEHGFVSFFGWGEDLGAIWLDGSELAALTIDELFELEEAVGMTLRFARFRPDGSILERGEIDELVCDCCQTDAVSTADGPVIVYRDRTQQEERDISVRYALPAGSASLWSQPVQLGPDGWIIDGCPVNGPAMASAGEQIAVAWFTAAGDAPRLRFARSGDAGRSFTPAITLAAAGTLGQADVVVTDDGTAWVSAWHRVAAGMELRVHRVSSANEIETRVIAASASSLPSDVPQMALAGGELVFAWSELGDPGQLFTATAPLW